MLAGTTSCQDIRLGELHCRLPRGLLANAGGSTWYALKTLAGSKPVTGSAKGSVSSRQHLSPERRACGECRRNYMTLWIPVRLRAAPNRRSSLAAEQR